MAKTGQEIAADRLLRDSELYALDARNSRLNDQSNSERITDTEQFDNLYAGRWDVAFPDETTESLPPMVMNLPQVAADEFARLVAETAPQLRYEPGGKGTEEIDAAYQVERIGQTHWLANDGEDLLIPQLGLDMASTGMIALTVGQDTELSDYPVLTRMDPRGVYPTFAHNRLVDAIVVTRMTWRQAEAQFGRDAMAPWGEQQRKDFEIEVIELYEKDSVTTVIARVGQEGGTNKAFDGYELRRWDHGLGTPSIAIATLPQADGRIRGMYNNIAGIVLAQNRIFNLQLDYADQLVYAPWFAHDVENDTARPGPGTVFRGRTAESKMQRLAPAGENPQLFGLLEMLERQGRGGAAYPAQRQGEVTQSIASASFVNSTLGQFTTQIKFGQKRAALLRKTIHELMYRIDRKFLDFEKPLLVPSDTGKYSPSKDIPDLGPKSRCRLRIAYGAGAGLDALNKKAALHADLDKGLVSQETAREQLDYVMDPSGEGQKVERERVRDALLARITQDPNVGVDLLMRYAALLNSGDDLMGASEKMSAIEEQARAEQQAGVAQGAGPVAPGAGTPPSEPTPEQYAAGAAGPAGPQPPQAPPSNILVRQPGA